MKTINLTIPEYLNYDETEWKIILAGELYERGKLSLGQAADLAGFSKRVFIELMGKYGFSVFNDSIEDLKSDIKNA
jgi:predicted HTH domain antitoxin